MTTTPERWRVERGQQPARGEEGCHTPTEELQALQLKPEEEKPMAKTDNTALIANRTGERKFFLLRDKFVTPDDTISSQRKAFSSKLACINRAMEICIVITFEYLMMLYRRKCSYIFFINFQSSSTQNQGRVSSQSRLMVIVNSTELYHRTPVVEGGNKRCFRFSTVNPKVPMIKDKKEKALGKIVNEYQQELGKSTSEKQLKKKVQNMKAEVKKKTDKTATGNKKIVLKPWEKELLDLLTSNQNPVFSKIPDEANCCYAFKFQATSVIASVRSIMSYRYTNAERTVVLRLPVRPSDYSTTLRLEIFLRIFDF
ncbi:hypothetical protein ANN_10095 [Periplaneta americana]|uniref:Uncharacterized protein n=1 Tax=Periplaneta americana TaxID=6978 RepID=A0ABQ8TQF5_PERAM|nr:hypothetical protein ANN_10095 [Periplaneta americana]